MSKWGRCHVCGASVLRTVMERGACEAHKLSHLPIDGEPVDVAEPVGRETEYGRLARLNQLPKQLGNITGDGNAPPPEEIGAIALACIYAEALAGDPVMMAYIEKHAKKSEAA